MMRASPSAPCRRACSHSARLVLTARATCRSSSARSFHVRSSGRCGSGGRSLDGAALGMEPWPAARPLPRPRWSPGSLRETPSAGNPRRLVQPARRASLGGPAHFYPGCSRAAPRVVMILALVRRGFRDFAKFRVRIRVRRGSGVRQRKLRWGSNSSRCRAPDGDRSAGRVQFVGSSPPWPSTS